MKFAIRISALTLAAALALTFCVNSARAGNKRPAFPPEPIPTYYNGDTYYVVPGGNRDAGNPDNAIAIHAANPIYFVYDVDGNLLQDPVLSTVPGVAGYNPYWNVVNVVVPQDQQNANGSYPLLTSESDIPDAWKNATDTVLLCQVVDK